MDARTIINRFGYHPASTSEQQERHATVRSIFMEMALILGNLLPDGYDRDETLRYLEYSQRAASAALALGHSYADVDELDDRTLVTIYRTIYGTRYSHDPSDLPRGTLLSEIKRYLAPPAAIEPVYRTQAT